MTEGHSEGPRPGWYPDPEGTGQRWWNGASWGEQHEAGQGKPYDQPRQEQGMRCVYCQWTDFTTAEFVLTPGGKFFDRGIGMATARCLICRRCGFISWFATR